MRYTVNLADVGLADVGLVGGKNASTGEMLKHLLSQQIRVPIGFATTAEAYQDFLARNQLDKKINQLISTLKVNDPRALLKTSNQIKKLFIKASFSKEFELAIQSAYSELDQSSVAVRSSATMEDMALASFAGQQETYLNIQGTQSLLRAIKLVYASTFTARAMAYRHHHGFESETLSMSVGVQKMVRSDKGASGVIFTVDTESGFDKVILITASYGLGEALVQGGVSPDEFLVYKPLLEKNKFAILERKLGEKAHMMVYTNRKEAMHSTKIIPVIKSRQQQFCLTDEEVQTLAKQALLIEKHYGKPMDIEWAKDGISSDIYIVQARPETVKSQLKNSHTIEHYELGAKTKILATGQSVGQRIGQGQAKVILHATDLHLMKPGSVLVTDMTDPDWEPIMKQAAAIVTNRGGRTCHAAIIARELGIPAVVGCGDATKHIKNNTQVTVSCADGQTGVVYEGKIPFELKKISVKDLPPLPVKICLNVGNPGKAFTTQFVPNEGVGLARLEFIISDMIGIHPNALLNISKLPKNLQRTIKAKTSAYESPSEFYIEKLREGIATIAAAFYPKEVIFRFSDFKSNEYANLLGGSIYEPLEENPMIGFRGASRYISEQFKPCFKLECEAIKRVRDEMGLTNAQVMIPFVRTLSELEQTVTLLKEIGLERGLNKLKLYMMCEIPSNVILAEEFLKLVDGYSIGSNDLTQLTLGLDRDSSLVATSFDERNEAVKKLLHHVIQICNKNGKYIGICGQGPSDYPEFAKWLMQQKIQAISLSADTVVDTWLKLANSTAQSVEQTAADLNQLVFSMAPKE